MWLDNYVLFDRETCIRLIKSFDENLYEDVDFFANNPKGGIYITESLANEIERLWKTYSKKNFYASCERNKRELQTCFFFLNEFVQNYCFPTCASEEKLKEKLKVGIFNWLDHQAALDPRERDWL